jgi:Cu+-exporting ATPase
MSSPTPEKRPPPRPLALSAPSPRSDGVSKHLSVKGCGGTLTTVLLANNIHCASCVAFVKEVLAFLPSIKEVDVSILTQEVRIHHGSELATSDLAASLIDAAFEVHHATTYNEAGTIIEDIDTSSWTSYGNRFVSSSFLSTPGSPRPWQDRQRSAAQRRHIENCDACRTDDLAIIESGHSDGLYREKGQYSESKPLYQKPVSDDGTLVTHDLACVSGTRDSNTPDPPSRASPLHSKIQQQTSILDHQMAPVQASSPEEFDARISISGMTCAACVNTITDSLQQLEFVKTATVNLLTNSATLTYLAPRENIDGVIKEIEETGFEASIDEVTAKCPPRSEDFEVRLSIGGMTCASCVSSITQQLKQLNFVKDVSVTLLTNSATVIYSGAPSEAERIKDEIEDIGFEASIEEVRALSSHEGSSIPTGYTANISIGGMTCGACVGTITRGLQELPFLRDASVDLLSNSAKVEFEAKDDLDKIVEKIEDLGYDASVVECVPLEAENPRDSVAAASRTIMIRVDGMFCHHCPEKVLESLNTLSDTVFEIEQSPSVKNPIVKITYTPNPPSLTVRKIISTINSAHDAFKASIYHPPSIEDRSRAMQIHERRRLLTRLLFVLIVAIPTFLIGIVFMSLVSPDNKIRIFLEQPVWQGKVSRMEWALFIMTTPMMFYGADVFHVRALKEIKALWRPGSKVPILRRFYRFGSMNLLMSAGTMVAYVSSLAVLIVGATVDTPSSANVPTYFDSVVFLTLFILGGRWLEAYSKAKTGDAVTALGKLRPTEALLVTDESESESSEASGRIQRINVDLLEIGDTVNVPHGASPPADGVVTGSGKYQFDESSLTGESKPVTKEDGDKVYSGSVNVGQPVSIVVTELGGTSVLDQIVAVVREGQSKRAPLERVADLIIGYFVPVITLIAILTFVIWLALGQSGVLPPGYLDNPLGGWAFWSLQFAIAVFVVACPCGLALAAPTALFVGVGLAAKRGILVRGGGEAFQEATRLDAIVFDKTGTLTEGSSLKVSDHEVLTKDSDQELVAWTLAHELEQKSNHPIARAISDFCSAKPLLSVSSSDITEMSGQGMKGTFTLLVEGNEVTYEAAIGNERLARSLASPGLESYFFSNLLSRYQSSGKSTAILLLRKLSEAEALFTPTIIFATSDPIRAESVGVISQLQKRHIDVFMCTGDNETTAYAVAAALGIPRSNVMANVLPAQKAEFIRKVQEDAMTSHVNEIEKGTTKKKTKRPIVAFVGDGTNDSPALAAADVSIAMASGSDVAINSASFILLNSNLSTILELVLLSRRVFARVKMNFCWAAVYNLSLVPVAAGVFYPIGNGKTQEMMGNGMMMTVESHWRLSPVWAALAMALSSVSVVSSSLALRIEVRRTIRKLFKRSNP